MLVKERKHNTNKYSKYWVGDSSVLEKICKNYQKLGGWLDDTGKNLQKVFENGVGWWFWRACRFFQHTFRPLVSTVIIRQQNSRLNNTNGCSVKRLE